MTALYNQWQSLLRGLASVSMILKISQVFLLNTLKGNNFKTTAKLHEPRWRNSELHVVLESLSSSLLLQPLVCYSTLVLNLWFCLLSRIAPSCQLNRQHLHITAIDHAKNETEITHCTFLLSAAVTATPNLMAILLLKFTQHDNKSTRDLLSKDAFYQATKQTGQTSSALRFVFLLMSLLTPPQRLDFFGLLVKCCSFQNISSDLEGKRIYSNNKRRIQKIFITCIQLQLVSTLCWLFKVQFHNISSKLSSSDVTVQPLEQEFPILTGKKPHPSKV